MLGLTLHAPFSGMSGYEEVVRNLAQALYLRGVRLRLEELPWGDTKVPMKLPEREFYNILQNTPKTSNIVLNITIPEGFNIDNHSVNLNFSMFEADRIPKIWALRANAIAHTFVPTESSRSAWINSGVMPHKVSVIPLGVDHKTYNPEVSPMPFLPVLKYPIRFVVVQEVVERKNLDGALNVWLKLVKEHGPDMKACLILKLSNNWIKNRFAGFKDKFNALLKKYGVPNEQQAHIFITNDWIDDWDMPSFLALGTHYWSMSKGEGWDLTAIKMAAMGKRIVVPNHSSYSDWVPKDRGVFIPISGTEDAIQNGPTERLYRGSQWWIPDEEAALDILKNEVESGPPETDLVLAEQVRKGFSWELMAEKVETAIDGLKDAQAVEYDPRGDKVLMVCRSKGMNCGIASYTDKLVSAVPGVFSGHVNDVNFTDIFKMTEIGVVHIQHQYDFYTPEGLENLLGTLSSLGVRIVVTMHTYNKGAIDQNNLIVRYADTIFTHSKKDAEENGFVYTVMGMGPIHNPGHAAIKSVRVPYPKPGKINIAFFGFAFFHKGLRWLIGAVEELQKKNPDYHLYILSSKNHFDKKDCIVQYNLMLSAIGMKEGEHYTWVDKYLPENSILDILSMCDLIVLPYEDYGSRGTSIAVRTCLRNSTTPVLTSKSPFFDDVRECTFLWDGQSLSSTIEGCLQKDASGVLGNAKKFAGENSWESVLKRQAAYYTKQQI